MLLSALDYHLPSQQIAQHPLADRAASRLLLFNRSSGHTEDHHFAELPALLRGDELLVLNNTRVIPARLFGHRLSIRSQVPSKATHRQHPPTKIEVLLIRQLEAAVWEALVRPGRKIPVGERVGFGDGRLEAEVLARGDYGIRTLKFSSLDGSGVMHAIEELGHVPLPPYINREDDSADRERYQTVFAKQPGAVAAPTAGLHFTPPILEKIRARGAEICELTLHVGLGTFQPIHGETLEGHVMHAEAYEIPVDTAERIRAARAAGRPILAVGTTVVRALEDAALRASVSDPPSLLSAGPAEARLLITPGFPFRVVDALLTNFHLPRSTLLALVCAFAGPQPVMAAYHHAVSAGYRFYSYGDCMLIR